MPACQMEMVSNNSPEGVSWEQAVVVYSFQSLSGTLQPQILLLTPLHRQELPLQHFRIHLASSSSEKENKKFHQGFVFILFYLSEMIPFSHKMHLSQGVPPGSFCWGWLCEPRMGELCRAFS